MLEDYVLHLFYFTSVLLEYVFNIEYMYMQIPSSYHFQVSAEIPTITLNPHRTQQRTNTCIRIHVDPFHTEIWLLVVV